METAADRLAMLKAAGDPILYFDHSDLHEIYGIRTNEYQKVESDRGPAVGSSRPALLISTDTVAAPAKGDQVYLGTKATFQGEFEHEVVSVRPDETENMVVVVLKKL
jgi:hypothetical protein